MIADVEISEERHFTFSVLKNFALVKLNLNDKQNYYGLTLLLSQPLRHSWFIYLFFFYISEYFSNLRLFAVILKLSLLLRS